MEGKIVKIISSDFTVSSENFLYTCKARGKFRNQNITPIVGDNVIFENNVIKEVLKRKNYLRRPPVANIDQVIVVVSLCEPALDLYLLEKCYV